MPLKFRAFSHDSASSAQEPPPFGAPTGHFGDVTDNIQREALAATNDLGQAVFGNDLGGGAHQPGAAVQVQPAGDVTATDVNQLKQEFAQLVYDMANPVGRILMISSTETVDAATILNPSGLSATWVPCDGVHTDAPDLRGVVGGADPNDVGGTGATHTGQAGANTLEGSPALSISNNIIEHGHPNTQDAGEDNYLYIPEHYHEPPNVGLRFVNNSTGSSEKSVLEQSGGGAVTWGQASSGLWSATGGVQVQTDLDEIPINGAVSPVAASPDEEQYKHTHPIEAGDLTGNVDHTVVEFWIRTT